MPSFLEVLSQSVINLRAWAQDYAYALRQQASGLVNRGDPQAYRQSTRQEQPTLVLIPGVYENWSFMKPVADVLYKNRYDVCVVEDLKFNTGTVEDMADVVANFLLEQRINCCVLVAHSKGGLIGKYLLAHYNERAGIQGLVTLNTPFSGSKYAYLLPLKAIRLFLPRSPQLTHLTSHEEVNKHIISIYGRFDPHIPGGSRLEGARNIQLNTRGHFRPLKDSRVHQTILDSARTFAL